MHRELACKPPRGPGGPRRVAGSCQLMEPHSGHGPCVSPRGPKCNEETHKGDSCGPLSALQESETWERKPERL